jgi:hypothetical protein
MLGLLHGRTAIEALSVCVDSPVPSVVSLFVF